MINEKQQILEKINTLPEDNDAMYRLYFNAKLAKSRENLKNGNVITLKELKKYIDELEARYADNNIE